MRTTIDGAGRVVIPKAVRDIANLRAGSEIDIAFRDGRIELEAVGVPMRIEGSTRSSVIEAAEPMPLLTTDDVRDVLDRTRR